MAAAPQYTMVLDQSAHLDWDWIRTFAQNYWYSPRANQDTPLVGVNEILNTAIKNGTNQPSYYYTICEMGFFRRYIETNPAQAKVIEARGDNFQVISGGITSADCLVCSGEAFVRNYLVGQVWLYNNLVGMKAKPHCWLPDDFGLGPELPTLLTALGFVSVGFSRLAGTQFTCIRPVYTDDLEKNGFDFMWKASDGSTIFTHYLIKGYNVGNILSDPNYSDTAIATYVSYYNPNSVTNPPTYSSAKTNFMYIPLDDDFTMPQENLAEYISNWNTSKAAENNVKVVQGTFDQFVNAVLAANKQDSVFQPKAYNGTPYFTGYYASRPELKILHYETVRALMATEVIGLLTQPSSKTLYSMLPTDFWARVDQVWNDFLPSTHHDYVCGTATDGVYAGEQLPVARGSAAAARALRNAAMIALGGMISTAGPNSPAILVVNPLGFLHEGIAEIEDIIPFATSLTWPDGTQTTTQPTYEGGMLLSAKVQSFGFLVTDGTDSAPQSNTGNVSITPSTSGATSYTLQNQYLSATITEASGWSIANLVDIQDSKNPILDTPGNVITFYDDSQFGGIYQFGNEYKPPNLAPDGTQPKGCLTLQDAKVTTSGPCLGALVLESGPLRVRLRTVVSYEVPIPQKPPTSDTPSTSVCARFEREYELRDNEPFLRMTTTGAAPKNISVMTKFPFKKCVQKITHGTAYHWTDIPPTPGFWDAPVFQPTHDWLMPYDSGNNLQAAIYHAGMPAWASDTNGALIGCILRNTPATADHGAAGSDPSTHTQRYALRVPSGLGAPTTGQPLREAQRFHTPLLAIRLPEGPDSSLTGMICEPQGTLASTPSDSSAILTVAKPGSYDPTSLVLRLYQPTNKPLTVNVTLPSPPFGTKMLTATESEWKGEGSVVPNNTGASVNMVGAVATISLPGLGRRADPPVCKCVCLSNRCKGCGDLIELQ